jgi:hypothetical protein
MKQELDLNILRHYMFSHNHIMDLCINKLEPEKMFIKTNKVVNISKKSNMDNIFVPKEKDTLFWCFYIIQNGMTKYEMLGNKSFQEEKLVKIQIVETLRNYKEIFKQYKWKRNNIETDLVYNAQIELNTFLCICRISNINIVVLKNRCIYTLISDTNLTDDIHIVEFKDIGFGYNILSKECAIDKFNKYCLEYWLIENISKPLLAQTKYKVAALCNICKKLDIPILNHSGKKLKKIELYNLIKLKI